MRELALFAGAGGGILGSHLLGWTTLAAVEIERYPRDVLLQRQRDGILTLFPIWDDIRTFDGNPWRGWIDIVTGGFPCSDISCAGKRTGIDGPRSGLWKEMVRVVYEVQPQFVFVENVSDLTRRGLGVVLGDLAKMGYDARWCMLGADDAGAPHRRKRIWILAYSLPERLQKRKTQKKNTILATKRMGLEKRIEWWDIDPADLPYTKKNTCNNEYKTKSKTQKISKKRFNGIAKYRKWSIESRVGRVVDGMAYRVDRLKAIGNGQVPAVAALAFIILSEGLI